MASWLSSLFQTQPPPNTTPVNEHRILEEPSQPIPSTITLKADEAKLSQVVPQAQNHTEPSNRNKLLLGAGLGFFAFSMLITRRSFARKRLAAQAAFYSDAPGHHVAQSQKVSGAMEALEALNIATINVLSLAMIATGGSLWYLDINNMDDARRMLRGGLGVDGSGRSEKDAEEEFEEWMATTLSRKEAKEKREKPSK